MNPIWHDLAAGGGISLSPRQIQMLDRYLHLLLEANQRMNLTRITDLAQAEMGHVADALTLLPLLPRDSHELADVGSGGGAPGIPLAIARPDVRVTLIESTAKKALFLRETVAALELPNAQVIHDRVENVGQGDRRESFDIAVARALATLDWLVEWLLPLVKTGGQVLAMKGPKAQAELAGVARIVAQLGGSEAQIIPTPLPGGEHRLVIKIAKLRPTDRRWPRSPTAAKGKPMR
jgi:16S rRNA (guanine527-N7)-methyltransferase